MEKETKMGVKRGNQEEERQGKRKENGATAKGRNRKKRTRWVGKREMGRKRNRHVEKDRNRDSYKVWKKQVLQE